MPKYTYHTYTFIGEGRVNKEDAKCLESEMMEAEREIFSLSLERPDSYIIFTEHEIISSVEINTEADTEIPEGAIVSGTSKSNIYRGGVCIVREIE